MRKQLIWLAVTADKFELPIATADTAKELAKILNTTEGAIILMKKKNCNGKLLGYRVRAVEDVEVDEILDKVNMEELVRTVFNRAKEEARPEGDVLKEELIKIAQCHTDQDNDKEHNKTFNNIIAPGENIDNGQVYSEVTGETLRDL